MFVIGPLWLILLLWWLSRYNGAPKECMADRNDKGRLMEERIASEERRKIARRRPSGGYEAGLPLD